MYIEFENKLLKKVEIITGTEYDCLEEKTRYSLNSLGEKVEITTKPVSVDSIISMIEDLIYEHKLLLEKYDDLREDMEENYEPKKFDPYMEYGINENDFH